MSSDLFSALSPAETARASQLASAFAGTLSNNLQANQLASRVHVLGERLFGTAHTITTMCVDPHKRTIARISQISTVDPQPLPQIALNPQGKE